VREPEPIAQELAALFRSGRHAELERRARERLQAAPHDGVAWKALGVACAALDRPAEALSAKQRAADLRPDDAEAHCNLANALAHAQRPAHAEAAFRRALELDPQLVTAWSGLAALLRAQARPQEALPCMRRVAGLQPASAPVHNELGNLLRDCGRMREARSAYEAALALQADHVEALANLGSTLADLGLPADAEDRYRAALALAPARAEIHNNLANLLKQTGRIRDAAASYRRAVELDPAFLGAYSNLLLSMNHDPRIAPADVKREAMRFGAVVAGRAGVALAARGTPRRAGPLRIGFVSGDLRNHPVGYFLEGPLGALAAEGLELFAYQTVPQEDALTARLRPCFRQWRPIAALGDEAAARQIRDDGIDVLVDLSGHTAYNRLGLFAWRPAPVQATWLGYFATTGVAAMDWLVADRTSIEPAEASDFTERICYLPDTRLCFSAPRGAPKVAAAPALSRGFITFGSFQNLGKIGDDVLACWSKVLAAVPSARLRLQNAQLGDGALQAAMNERLRRCGIDPARVAMHGRQPRDAYLQAHAEVDIVLDTFPYPGGTTTCEALWMGVPTVTLAGDRMLSRQGASLLEAARLPAWIARDRDDYVTKAVAAAHDAAGLQALRRSLRAQVAASPLFDSERFARHFAHALRAMAECEDSGPSGSSSC
jgi:protein O-GlcNAc transferase